VQRTVGCVDARFGDSAHTSLSEPVITRMSEEGDYQFAEWVSSELPSASNRDIILSCDRAGSRSRSSTLLLSGMSILDEISCRTDQGGAILNLEPLGLSLVAIPSVDDVHSEALKAAREIVADGEQINGMTFEVCDESGLLVHRLPFRSVID